MEMSMRPVDDGHSRAQLNDKLSAALAPGEVSAPEPAIKSFLESVLKPGPEPIRINAESGTEPTSKQARGRYSFPHHHSSTGANIPTDKLRTLPASASEPIPESETRHGLFGDMQLSCSPIPVPCHEHHHSQSSQSTSTTVVISPQSRNHGDSHAHFHSSGICCSKSDSSSEDLSLKDLDDTPNESEHSDIERGPPSFERVVLRIDGLKCGCCEGGIARAVSRISAIKNYQVNIVLARVEFDLDTSRLSVAESIKALSSKTGYIFQEHIPSTGQILEFIVMDTAHMKHAGQPYGVIRFEAPDREPWRPLHLLSGRNSTVPTETIASAEKMTLAEGGNADTFEGAKHAMATCTKPPTRQRLMRVHYDATKIGARDVRDYYWRFDPSLRLAPPAAHPSLAVGAKQTRRALYLFLPTLGLTIPVVVFAWAPVSHDKLVYAHVSLALATVVQLIAFREFVPNALRSLYHSRMFEMDFLIALSTTIAYVFSVVSYVYQIRGKPLETGSFFETSTLLVTLILLGRVINEFARFRAAKSVSFRSLQSDEVLLVLPNSTTPNNPNPRTEKIDARLLQYGDEFVIPPHTKVVTDGVVLYGGSEIDESMITGESIPVAKAVYSEVSAGTHNGNGLLVVKLTKLPHENSVHRIAAMVEDAELTKPKVQALADRIASWFVPVIATLGLLVFFTWLFVDRYHFKHAWSNSVITAVTYAIATLIVSCPCAIGLAVPMVVLIAGGVAARFGIIFRDPQKLEIARNVTDIVFDKTGTLTCGFPAVWEVDYHGTDATRTKGILLGLLKDVKHPVSAGVLRYLEQETRMNSETGIKPLKVIDIISVPGEGVEGICADTELQVRAGNPEWLSVHIERPASTLFCVKIGETLHATFKLEDRPRPTAGMVIEKLKGRGIEVHMISGDNQGAVDDIAHSLDILKRNTRSRCKPDGKMNYVKDLQRPGKVVMFVGDGTNDAVALKQADVGVHINQGSDVAKSAADVVLMTARLHDVLILLDISRAAYRRIILNFGWSALYNVVAILLAAGALVKAGEQIRIKPQWAGLGELVSVLPVVLIAFQMRWRNYGKQYRAIEYDYMKAEPQKGVQLVRLKRNQHSSSSDDAGCCMVSPTKLQAMARWKETGKV